MAGRMRLGIAAAGMALLLAGASRSAEPLPWLGRVTGVAPGDALNVRAAPSAEAERLGALLPGLAPVEVTATDATGRWGRIIWEEGDAWVSLRFLAPLPRPRLREIDLPEGLLCLGTEPFWSLRLEAGAAILSTPDAEPETLAWRWATPAAGDAGEARAFAAGERIGLLRAAACSDGMSDRSYGWALDLLAPDRAEYLAGCCFTPLP